jgi:hypothetical protein
MLFLGKIPHPSRWATLNKVLQKAVLDLVARVLIS